MIQHLLVPGGGDTGSTGSCSHRQSSLRIWTHNQWLISLPEALGFFSALSSTSSSASYLNNMKSVFCQNIIVPFSLQRWEQQKEGRGEKTLSQFMPIWPRRLLGHGSIRGISPQMGLQASMKKGRKGGGCSSKQESRNIEMQTDI